MSPDRSDDALLLAQIKRRRNDPEFMDRLRQMIDDDHDVLERMADGPMRQPGVMPNGRQPAIRRVLAQYRSTDGHVSEAEITEAWTEYEALRGVARAIAASADVARAKQEDQ